MQGVDYILTNEEFQQTLSEIADDCNESFESVQEDAANYLKELYSEHDAYADSAMFELIRYTLSRGYDATIDVNPDEIKSLGKLMRRHSVAFVMTHKTYIDMWALTLVLARHGLPIPYIFAGINLSFFGAGKIGRKAGIIFIRRSFKDNEIYKATLRHFLAHLVKEKEHFMWAIEGTRSRTGKLVWPKMGILKYIAEGEKQSKDEVKYVPVSVVYDLIQDVQEMTNEGRGKEKKSENLKWMYNYIKGMGKNYGKISIRIGDPIEREEEHFAEIPDDLQAPTSNYTLPKLAFELVHRINHITPVTTASLICTTLLSKFSLTKNLIEHNVLSLMKLVENHKADALVDRGVPISQTVTYALNILKQAGLVQQLGEGAKAKYAIVPEKYLMSTYYSNMCVHHLYQRAFIELSLLKVADEKPKDREEAFWTEIMSLRDLFKFEFFYSNKANFSDEIEFDFELMDPQWQKKINGKKESCLNILRSQAILISPVVLYTYLEAYSVVGMALLNMDNEEEYNENKLLHSCMFLGEEMHWQGGIHRIESVSKPFIINGLRFAKNRGLIPTQKDKKAKELNAFLAQLQDISTRIKELQEYVLRTSNDDAKIIPLERNVVPGSKTESITEDVLQAEEGAHIGAFFDLDRTLIKGFSATKFFKARLMSGKMKNKEILAQFGGALVYAVGDKNFASLAAIGAKGVKGIREQMFIEVGEEVYYKHLAHAIYPESRALVAAHVAKGHTVAIISAATPYQVNPVATDLGIEHVMCTKMEVVNGKFTGDILQPACWGEGKAFAANALTKELNLDLSKSYFYTDSAEDMPLMEIVGNPIAINPDKDLSAAAYQNNWPVYRFDDQDRSTGIANYVRTALTLASLFPAAAKGVLSGTRSGSWSSGRNSMMATFGDLGAKFAGINLAVKGEDKLWSNRPCVFILNHQSNADMIVASKLLRKDTVGIGKKEIQKMPIIGQILSASKGMIFIDRSDKKKAIEAMKPAIDALKNGTSVVIFPEGTRSYDYTLGEFKKGAFHLAMGAKVPIMPIVIENAHDVMPRGRSLVQPATIRINVLDPIETKNWKKKDLNGHISRIRDLYLDALGQKEVKVLS